MTKYRRKGMEENGRGTEKKGGRKKGRNEEKFVVQ